MATVQTGSLRPTHGLLAVQSLVILLLSINRLSTLTLGYVAENEFLRWVDFNNMLILPLISVIAFYLLKKHTEYDSPQRESKHHLALNILFLVGVYLLAAGYGNHEVTNYLHTRFCQEDTGSILCSIISFNDDEFSHWVFFAGFVFINASVMLIQVVFPYAGRLTFTDHTLLIVNALFIGLGIFANLAFEEIGIDLYVIALLAVLAVLLRWQYRSQPLLIYYSTAYVFGLLATLIYRSLAA